LLGPLADNGGSHTLPDGSHVLTHENLANSGNNGVRDRGPSLVFGAPTDERGFPGLVDGKEDIGAFEFQDFDVAVSTAAPAGTVHALLPATFTFPVSDNGPNTSHGVTLTAKLPAGTIVLAGAATITVSGNVATLAVPDLAAGASTTVSL